MRGRPSPAKLIELWQMIGLNANSGGGDMWLLSVFVGQKPKGVPLTFTDLFFF